MGWSARSEALCPETNSEDDGLMWVLAPKPHGAGEESRLRETKRLIFVSEA